MHKHHLLRKLIRWSIKQVRILQELQNFWINETTLYELLWSVGFGGPIGLGPGVEKETCPLLISTLGKKIVQIREENINKGKRRGKTADVFGLNNPNFTFFQDGGHWTPAEAEYLVLSGAKWLLCVPCIGSPIYVHCYNVCPSCKSVILSTYVCLVVVLFFCKIDSQSFSGLYCCKDFCLALSHHTMQCLVPFSTSAESLWIWIVFSIVLARSLVSHHL